VYKARQLSTSQLVAIKVMHMSRMPTANSDIAAGRFEREMKLIAQLKHPNIVRLIDTGKTQQGAPFNVLELIEGQPLDTYIRDHGAFDARKAQHLMFQVLDALSAAHEAGVVHRDLKPSNIMVTTTGYRPNATVLDFGLSAVMEAARPADYVELTAQIDSNLGYAGGTPSYVAPEMLQKGLSSPQCDVYAWGLVFLECMTGSKIVDGPTEIAVLMRQGSDEPVPIPDDLPLSPILRAVITRAVAKPLDVRYTSATAVIRDHEDMASGAAPIPKLDLRASQRFAPSYADALPTDQMPFTRDDLAETVQEHPTDDAIRRSFGLVTEQNPAVPRPESVTAGPGRVQHGDIHQASTRDLPAIAPPLDPDDGGRLPLIGVLIVAACVGLAIWLGVRFIAQSSQQAKTPPIKAERIEESEADSTTPEEENKQTEPEAEPIACTTHSACSALSKTARCGPKHMCIEAVTERCSTVDGSLQDDDAILIGSIAKRLLEGDSGVAIQNGVALAVTEINNQGGLPGGRKLVHVGCNSEGTASGALEASRHLINNLNVHSIVGPGRSKAFLEVIPFAVRKGVMLISPSATSPVLTNLDDKGLGWRTAASDRQQAFAIADLLAQRKYTRIAALVYDDVYAQALLDNIRARFESNTGQKHAIIARIYTDPSSDKFNNTLSALIDKVPSPQAVLVLGHEEVADVIRAHHKASAGKLTHYMVSEGGRKTRTVALTHEIRFHVRGLASPLLVLSHDTEASNRERAVFRVQGGRLIRKGSGGTMEFRVVEEIGGPGVLATLYGEQPGVWWPFYVAFQQLLHVSVLDHFER
ncbi:MAG: bifunctional serine/threonine-protein kinase/ABC transporter substrate-binding protein, partial [Myxococcota bacterium]